MITKYSTYIKENNSDKIYELIYFLKKYNCYILNIDDNINKSKFTYIIGNKYSKIIRLYSSIENNITFWSLSIVNFKKNGKIFNFYEKTDNFNDIKTVVDDILDIIYNLDIEKFLSYKIFKNKQIHFKERFFKNIFKNNMILNIENLNKNIFDIFLYFFKNNVDLSEYIKYIKSYLTEDNINKLNTLKNAKNFDLI